MLIKTMLFTQAPAQQGNPLLTFLPIIVMFIALYLLFILPQQRAAKKHKKMLDEMKKGDKVLTQAGFLGEVTQIKDDLVTLEVAPKIEMKIIKSTITKIIQDTDDLKVNE